MEVKTGLVLGQKDRIGAPERQGAWAREGGMARFISAGLGSPCPDVWSNISGCYWEGAFSDKINI